MRNFSKCLRLLVSCTPLITMVVLAAEQDAGITLSGGKAVITAGRFVRMLDLSGNKMITTDMKVDGTSTITVPGRDFEVTFYQAEPNKRPVGLKPGDAEPLDFGSVYQNWLKVTRAGTGHTKMEFPITGKQAVEWKNLITIDGEKMSAYFKIVHAQVTNPKPNVTRLNVRARVIDQSHPLHHVAIDVFYEVYDGFPVIRKWVEFTNNGPNWLKIDGLTIDAIDLAGDFSSKIPLTPKENGAQSTAIAFGNKDQSKGVIAASEVPSALRSMADNGSMGYTADFFEWVLGPSERFVSEPVFHFAYSGKVEKTASAVSTPLDRAVEGPYMRFLEEVIKIRATTKGSPAPVWCSWANFAVNVDDKSMRQQADVAARAGFKTFLIDDGWSHPGLGNTEPDTTKFADFDATSQYIRSKGLRLGLWISCYRRAESQDLAALPDATTTPRVDRQNGVAMSFTSPWRDYFANDLAYMYDRFGATYVKEDFSNIIFGDITEGHESRTRKESILRGLRGLLAVNDAVAHRAPGMVTQPTHEIYWGTPGVPCDIAALKSCWSYHIPPNIHHGNPRSRQRIADLTETFDPQKLRQGVIDGCWIARQKYWQHRGLPLYPLEFYSAATVNYKGSLTTDVQDRQVCSWLMSTQSVYAGDLVSLTDENIEHYRKRFEMVDRLQKTYDIYHYFQFSGVPQPTDTDWHWWGKLNGKGFGAVVVIRGSEGAESRAINIPWAKPEQKYVVTALLQNKKLGRFSGRDLQSGKLTLALPAYGQEILELAEED